jgi:OFA family oxalate/formate antiporter-like MFS transporter
MIIAGIGVGGVYGTVGNALKWFPDKLALRPASRRRFRRRLGTDGRADPGDDQDPGFRPSSYFGLGQGIIVILAFFLSRRRPAGWPQNANDQSRRNSRPRIRQPIFWLMYFMFVIVGAGGLMVTAN